MEGPDEESDICTQDEEKCVKETVKAILVLDHSKKPFRQSDVLKYLSKKPNRKQWSVIVENSKKRLNEMGFKLVETKNTSAKSFILVSNSFPLPSMYRFANEHEVADRTLLILILTFIFMKEGNVSNADIFSHLHDLGIYNENKPIHEYFGDLKKKILNEFTSQLYLEKVVDKESDTIHIKWGERALAEVSKRSILEFVCKIGYEGAIQPKNLASYYQAALEEEMAAGGDENSQDAVITMEN